MSWKHSGAVLCAHCLTIRVDQSRAGIHRTHWWRCPSDAAEVAKGGSFLTSTIASCCADQNFIHLSVDPLK